MENLLANAFAVLDLDVDDDHFRDADASTSATSSDEYKLPLVWIDLEMTGEDFDLLLGIGLNLEVDRILEIACIITDGNLTKSVEGPDLVIHQTKECLDRMGEWCQSHHAASGLTERVLNSTVGEREAELQDFILRQTSRTPVANLFMIDLDTCMDKSVMEFVKRNIGTYTPLLAGNSIYVDFQFLKKYMPDLAGLFSHVLVDVSSVKALCCRWYPRDNRKAPSKGNKHRAMDDIRESVKELKFFKDNIFKPRWKK